MFISATEAGSPLTALPGRRLNLPGCFPSIGARFIPAFPGEGGETSIKHRETHLNRLKYFLKTELLHQKENNM